MHCTLFRFLSAGFLAVALATGAAALQAQEYGGPQQGQRGQSQGGGQGQGQGNRPRSNFPRADARGDSSHNSLSDSVRRVQQREPGVRVLSAERVPFDGRDINRIKYVDERGRVRYMDDAGNSRRRNVPPSDNGNGGSDAPPPPARGDNPSHP
jgi:hypothetical protein